MTYLDPDDMPPEDLIDWDNGWQEGYRVEGDAILDASGKQIGEVVGEVRFADTDEGTIQYSQPIARYF